MLPPTRVLLDLDEYPISANAGEGFGCRESGTAGCQLDRQYTSFRIQWSASALLELEVGTQETSCRWLSMGGVSNCGNYEAAQSSGSRLVDADWGFYGNIWFHYGDETLYPDTSGVTIHQLTITAYLA